MYSFRTMGIYSVMRSPLCELCRWCVCVGGGGGGGLAINGALLNSGSSNWPKVNALVMSLIMTFNWSIFR